MRPALFTMRVMHRRLRPMRHVLQARMMSLLIDLNDLAASGRGLRFFSIGRRNLVSFHERDHGDGRVEGLRLWVAEQLREAGIAPPGGATHLLCMPRLLGRAFNPLSVYFCHRPDGGLAALLYDVHNTFGERHAYAVAVEDAPRLRHGAEKYFHVSPFLPMAMSYRFDLRRPAAADGKGRLSVAIEGWDAEGLMIRAVMAGQRREMTDAALLRAALAMPLQGLRVLGKIHIEALKLWWKGARFHRSPPPPARAVTRGA